MITNHHLLLKSIYRKRISLVLEENEKLHFIILNYNPYYTSHSKFFECRFCTLNYDSCYTLYLDIKFAIYLDGNPNLWYKV